MKGSAARPLEKLLDDLVRDELAQVGGAARAWLIRRVSATNPGSGSPAIELRRRLVEGGRVFPPPREEVTAVQSDSSVTACLPLGAWEPRRPRPCEGEVRVWSRSPAIELRGRLVEGGGIFPRPRKNEVTTVQSGSSVTAWLPLGAWESRRPRPRPRPRQCEGEVRAWSGSPAIEMRRRLVEGGGVFPRPLA